MLKATRTGTREFRVKLCACVLGPRCMAWRGAWTGPGVAWVCDDSSLQSPAAAELLAVAVLLAPPPPPRNHPHQELCTSVAAVRSLSPHISLAALEMAPLRRTTPLPALVTVLSLIMVLVVQSACLAHASCTGCTALFGPKSQPGLSTTSIVQCPTPTPCRISYAISSPTAYSITVSEAGLTIYTGYGPVSRVFYSASASTNALGVYCSAFTCTYSITGYLGTTTPSRSPTRRPTSLPTSATCPPAPTTPTLLNPNTAFTSPCDDPYYCSTFHDYLQCVCARNATLYKTFLSNATLTCPGIAPNCGCPGAVANGTCPVPTSSVLMCAPTTSSPTSASPTSASPTTTSPTLASPTLRPTTESPTSRPSRSPTTTAPTSARVCADNGLCQTLSDCNKEPLCVKIKVHSTGDVFFCAPCTAGSNLASSKCAAVTDPTGCDSAASLCGQDLQNVLYYSYSSSGGGSYACKDCYGGVVLPFGLSSNTSTSVGYERAMSKRNSILITACIFAFFFYFSALWFANVAARMPAEEAEGAVDKSQGMRRYMYAFIPMADASPRPLFTQIVEYHELTAFWGLITFRAHIWRPQTAWVQKWTEFALRQVASLSFSFALGGLQLSVSYACSYSSYSIVSGGVTAEVTGGQQTETSTGVALSVGDTFSPENVLNGLLASALTSVMLYAAKRMLSVQWLFVPSTRDTAKQLFICQISALALCFVAMAAMLCVSIFGLANTPADIDAKAKAALIIWLLSRLYSWVEDPFAVLGNAGFQSVLQRVVGKGVVTSAADATELGANLGLEDGATGGEAPPRARGPALGGADYVRMALALRSTKRPC